MSEQPKIGYWVDGRFIALKRVKKAKKPLNYGWPDGPRKPIRKVSKKRGGRLRKYSVQRKKFLEEHPACQFCTPLETCTKPSKDVHHKAGRVGWRLLYEADWMAICRPHHDWIHQHPGQARKLGMLK